MFGNKESKPEKLIFESMKDSGGGMGMQYKRAKVHGGWLVAGVGVQEVGITFVPDADHEWVVKIR